ncbi:hypothetical protein [Dactylosporangium sp. CA-092794]|uniref:hypothetical protein n=1 Tax=Dactylosporangium sp. CA-092794 TaxID=3239929 RepID=UPI003D918374
MGRLGVTRGQIERATERRLAGDWAGACVAAAVEVGFDLRGLADRLGSAFAARVAGDLPYLAPDLLRWHALRLRAETAAVEQALRAHGVGREAVLPLWIHEDGRRAVALHMGRLPPYRCRIGETLPGAFAVELGLHDSPELWDVRHAAALLARCGGVTRLPFFAADGTRLAADDLETGSPEGRAERMHRLLAGGRAAEAWAAAGFEVELTESASAALADLSPGLFTLAALARRTAARTGAAAVRLTPARAWSWPVRLVLDRLDNPGIAGDPSKAGGGRLRAVGFDAEWLGGIPALPVAAQDRPADFADLVDGRIVPAGLHPLVAAALFPALPTMPGPAPLGLPEPFRVRCEGEWHRVDPAAGTVEVAHPDGHLDRELAMLVLGGPAPTGCAAAYLGWRRNGIRLPRALRQFRARLLARIQHGEADTLEALLDAGLDPRLRAPIGRNLLHLLPWLEPEPAALALLPRLLTAGLDPAEPDLNGDPPAVLARRLGGHDDLAAALELAALHRRPNQAFTKE